MDTVLATTANDRRAFHDDAIQGNISFSNGLRKQQIARNPHILQSDIRRSDDDIAMDRVNLTFRPISAGRNDLHGGRLIQRDNRFGPCNRLYGAERSIRVTLHVSLVNDRCDCPLTPWGN